ncbi:MAG: HDOD domain-containing protein [Mariprofundaceae bacterium]|nr:HDOD domain-containing protein [Mariprofundaceae bacterium]
MTARVLVGGLMDLGIDKLSGNLPIYVKASREMLLDGVASQFPPEMLGIQLPSDMDMDDEILAVCREMRQQGRSIMLNGLPDFPEKEVLLHVVDSVKLDMQNNTDLSGIVEQLRPYSLRLVAGKVENREDHERAMNLGCTSFQGYFFCKPDVVEGRTLPDSKLSVLQAMRQVMTAEAISDVEEIILRDVTLSYRLLKYINSAAFGMRRKIESVQQALSLLGLANIQQWLSVMLLAAVGSEKPRELIKVTLLRGRVLEGIAELHDPKRKADYFILGLFSLLDTLLGVPMRDALDKLYLPDDIREGLLDPDSPKGRVLALAEALENDDWGLVDEYCRSIGIKCGDLVSIYTRAMHWVDEYALMLSHA